MAALDRLPQRDARVAVDERCTRRFPTREAVPRASPRRCCLSFYFRVPAPSHMRPGLDRMCAARLPPRINRRDLAVADHRSSVCPIAAGPCQTSARKLLAKKPISSIAGRSMAFGAPCRRVEALSSFFLIEVGVLSYAHGLSMLKLGLHPDSPSKNPE